MKLYVVFGRNHYNGVVVLGYTDDKKHAEEEADVARETRRLHEKRWSDWHALNPLESNNRDAWFVKHKSFSKELDPDPPSRIEVKEVDFLLPTEPAVP